MLTSVYDSAPPKVQTGSVGTFFTPQKNCCKRQAWLAAVLTESLSIGILENRMEATIMRLGSRFGYRDNGKEIATTISFRCTITKRSLLKNGYYSASTITMTTVLSPRGCCAPGPSKHPCGDAKGPNDLAH